LGIDWLDKYKADVLSSIRKLRFISKSKTIKVDIVNAKDQQVKDLKVNAVLEEEEQSYTYKNYIYWGKN